MPLILCWTRIEDKTIDCAEIEKGGKYVDRLFLGHITHMKLDVIKQTNQPTHRQKDIVTYWSYYFFETRCKKNTTTDRLGILLISNLFQTNRLNNQPTNRQMDIVTYRATIASMKYIRPNHTKPCHGLYTLSYNLP